MQQGEHAVAANALGRAVVTAVPTLDTAPYAAGDVLTNACVTFEDIADAHRGSFTINRLLVADAKNVGAPIELWLFGTDVPLSSNGSNQMFALNSNTVATALGVIGTGPYISAGSNMLSIASNLSLPVKLPTGTLYVVPVVRAAATYLADSLTINLDVTRD
jgi:hypothetical protein